MLKRDFSQKLSKVFLFWFALALLIPLITLVVFTLYTFDVRQDLLIKRVQENQLDLVLKVENHYKSTWIPDYSSRILDIVFDKEFYKEQSREEAISYYLDRLLPKLGFAIEKQDSIEKFIHYENKLPIRMQLIRFELTKNQKDIYEVLTYGSSRNLNGAIKKIHAVTEKNVKIRKTFYEALEARSKIKVSELIEFCGALHDLSSDLKLTKLYSSVKKLKGDELVDIGVLSKAVQELKSLRLDLMKSMQYLITHSYQGSSLNELDYLKAQKEFLKNFSKMYGDRRAVLQELLVKLKNKSAYKEEVFTFKQHTEPFRFPIYDYVKRKLKDEPLSKVNLNINSSDNMNVNFIISKDINDDEVRDYNDTVWPALSTGIRMFSKLSMLGLFGQDPKKEFILSALLGIHDLDSIKGTWFQLNSGGQTLRLNWNSFPSNDLSYYFSGAEVPPQGVIVSAIQNSTMVEFYCDLYNYEISADAHNLSNQEFREGISEYIQSSDFFKKRMLSYPELSVIDSEVFQLHRGLYILKGALDQKILEKDSKFYKSLLLYILGLDQSNPNLKYLNTIWRKNTFSMIRSKDSLLSQINNIANLNQDQSSAIKDWLQSPSSSYSFHYKKESREYIGTIYPSVFKDKFFFLSLPVDLAYGELDTLKALLILVLVFTILISLYLGNLLSSKVVSPVNFLTDRVVTFTKQGLDESEVTIKRNDEIGLMTWYFRKMIRSINQKVMELSSVNKLNEMLLKKDKDVDSKSKMSSLLSYAAQEFCQQLPSDFTYLAFFEQTSKEKLIASESYRKDHEPFSDEQKLKLHEYVCIELEKMKDKGGVWISPQWASEFGVQHFWLQWICAKSDHLNQVAEVLSASQEELEKQGADTMPVEGFLLLAEPSEDLFETINDTKSLQVEKQSFFNSLSSQAATVVSKAYLEKIQKDNVQGQGIQESLMPSKAPDSDGKLDIEHYFIAAKYLGGDFYDFVEFEDKSKIGFLISDVSGKGIGPSLFGSTLKAFLRLLALDPFNPGGALEGINNYANDRKKNSLFASAFYCTIDLDTMKFYYSSAGHNKMYLYRNKTKELEHLNAKGLVLGMFAPLDYETKESSLESGDWVILYTDGVNELENTKLELYGYDRFEKFIHDHVDGDAKTMKDDLIEDLEDFRKENDPSDDITFIVVKVK
ncbi:MAG: serine/threonine-protein phosphatase [Candidatus Cloacimonetes bacterium]|nr:serine/threonine-protein phosphatase [Candidatus Cloacimonadota bacterium]